jgi:hypothetical protein
MVENPFLGMKSNPGKHHREAKKGASKKATYGG